MSNKVPLPPSLQALYPFAGKTFDTAWGPLHYIEEGVGFPVIFLHGNPTWSFYYRNLIFGLRDHYRCLAPDHLGCGLSACSEDFPARLENHIDNLVDWIDSLGIGSFHLVVHDWGGAIGAGLIARMPDRVQGRVILNTAAFPFPSIPWRIAVCRIPFLGSLLVRGANGFVRAAQKMTTEQPMSEAVLDAYGFPFPDWESRRAVDAFVRDIPMRSSHPSWSTLLEIEASLADWKAEDVLICWGMKDWCFHPAILAEWKRRMPEAQVVEYADAGHYVLEDAGDAVLAEVKKFFQAMDGKQD